MLEPSASDLIALKLVRLVKIGRLSRIGRIKALRDLQYNGVLHPAAVQLVKLLFIYFFVLHMVACFYWYVAVNAISDDADYVEYMQNACDEPLRDFGRIAVWSMCTNVTQVNAVGRTKA